MTFSKLLAGSLMLLGSMINASNNDPVLLIHGLGAFKELWLYRDTLEDNGMTTFAVDVGKYTSNWDRAVEAYAQMKGTIVDYGVCHSREFGHERFGKDYTGQGLYPEWDEEHKIHVIGHSMGGPTMRVFEYLLRQGSGCDEDTHELFTGGKNWLTSLTAMSGVLDGTTFVDILDEHDLLELIKNVVVGLAAILDNSIADNLYDIDLSQWGLEREKGESFDDFWDRVEASGFLSVENKDISVYDLSEAGLQEFNSKGPLVYDDTFYFSFATERTHPTRDCSIFSGCSDWYEEADSGMLIFLHLTANLIGEESEPEKQKNDGLVNWVNQLCPTVVEADRDACVEYDGKNWEIGTWTYFNTDFLDHIQITLEDPINDIFNYGKSAKKLYTDHAKRLLSLPSTSVQNAVTAGEGSNSSKMMGSVPAAVVYGVVGVAALAAIGIVLVVGKRASKVRQAELRRSSRKFMGDTDLRDSAKSPRTSVKSKRMSSFVAPTNDKNFTEDMERGNVAEMI